MPERGGKKFFSLDAARAGKPGGIKIANADQKYMSLGGYSMRSSAAARKTTESEPKKTQKQVKSDSAKAIQKKEADESRREKLAYDIVGDIEKTDAKINRDALRKLFPALEEADKARNAAEKKGGLFAWPLDSSASQRISSHFGTRRDPFTGKRAFHKGIDIAAPIGTKVLASADGTVEAVATHARLGKYVKLRHEDGSATLYGHLSATLVKKGAQVKTGSPLGKVGSTGRSTGPHLDFSYRLGEEAVDPLPHLNVPGHIKTLEISDASK